MYATTRYNFVHLKATHKISPLEELVGGDLPPSSSQRLTGMHIQFGFNQDQISTFWDKKNCLMNFPISLYVQICPVVEAILNFQFAENTKRNIFQPHFLSNCLVVLNKKIFYRIQPKGNSYIWDIQRGEALVHSLDYFSMMQHHELPFKFHAALTKKVSMPLSYY